MFFKKQKKIVPPTTRTPDELPFQVYEIQPKEKKQAPVKRNNRFVSPIFGHNVKDEVVIPIRTKNERNMDSLDPFRTKPTLTKEDRIRKYGTAYPEFDLIKGKNLDEVLNQSSSKLKSVDKKVSAKIIHKEADPTPSFNEDLAYPNHPFKEDLNQNTQDKVPSTDDEKDQFNRSEIETPSQDLTDQQGVKDEENSGKETMNHAVNQESNTHEEPKTEPTPNEASHHSIKQTVKAGQNLYTNYQVPPVSLLKEPEESKPDLTEFIEKQTNRLNETFNEFNIGARVFNHTEGPTVTRFEIALEKGVKVSKVTTLTDNIKMALEAKDIRIEAPIPGKKTVGIEVPNEEAQTVHFSNIVRRSMFKNAAMPLTVALGLDIDGNPIYAPIKSMPHGLIAGATGSGKSVCINTLLMSLLLKYKPSELRLMLIDPKMVELNAYDDLPHLITPVITDAKAATAALNWVVEEMERRFQAFKEQTARDIDSYNKKIDNESEKLPYIVIVVDELADLMMVSSQSVEASIMRITQKARACGIHLIVATQRPSTDVVKGTIKSNIPTRIAFSVSSHVDSQTIIDTAGAETLLGRGDMLYVPSGQGKQRLQGAFVSDDDILTVTTFIKNQAKPNYLFTEDALVKSATKSIEEDDLLDEVAYYVVKMQEASINKISKQFQIGFNRAQRIVESLEAAGVVSKNMGSKAREVLVEEEDLSAILNQ